MHLEKHPLKKLELDIVIDTAENEVDMQYGLQTLKGTSDVVSLISEAILTGEIPSSGRRTHRSDSVRTKLKQSFKGSYGQKFAIEIENLKLEKKLRRIGDEVFLEVLSYFIMEALYLDSGDLTEGASSLLDELGGLSGNLFKRLKKPLINMHQVSKYYQHNVILHYRKRGLPEPMELVCLTEKTSRNLTDVKISPDEVTIEVVIIRYHSKTGNGRLHIKGKDQFVSFGFGSDIYAAKIQLRNKISENLHMNNLRSTDDGVFINLQAKKKVLPTGEVVKYLITGIHE